MNYLAHTLLSGTKPELIVGNFLMDIITKNEQKEIPDEFKHGFELHFAIDEFTDVHPSVKNITKILRQNHHKYAPVVSDILMDYVLGQNWEQYSTEPIQKFADLRYATIAQNLSYFPSRIRPIVAKMIDGNFLVRYTTIDGLRFTFEKIQEAARFKTDFMQAIEDLEENYDQLNKEFNDFFPDVIKHTSFFRQLGM
jgi:acyl carrier protein phosphodiesterase